MDNDQGQEKLGVRTLAAIVVTDTVSFSALTSENEDLALALVERDLSRMKVLCEKFGGKIVKSTGDGLILLFTSAVQAVSCSLEIQSEIHRNNQVLQPYERLQHRIGVYLGDVFVNGDEVFGEGINLASKLQSEASPGSVCVSASVHDVVKKRISFQSSPPFERTLKEIGKVTLFLAVPNDVPVIKNGDATKVPWVKYGAVLVGLMILALGGYFGGLYVVTFFASKPTTGGDDDSSADAANRVALNAMDEQTFINFETKEFADAEKALAGLPIHHVDHGVYFTLTPYKFYGLTNDEIVNVINLLASTGVSRIDLMPPTNAWDDLADGALASRFKLICDHIHQLGLKVGIRPSMVRLKSPANPTLADYQTSCAAIYPKMAADLRPDIFTVLYRPSRLARNLQLDSVTPEQWVEFATVTAHALKAKNPSIKIVVTASETGDSEGILTLLPIHDIDIIGLAIFSDSQFPKSLDVAQKAQAAGKRVAILESWRPTQDSIDPKTQKSWNILGDVKTEPLDSAWIRLANHFAETGPFESISFNWTPQLFLYEDTPVLANDSDYMKAAAAAALANKKTTTFATLEHLK